MDETIIKLYHPIYIPIIIVVSYLLVMLSKYLLGKYVQTHDDKQCDLKDGLNDIQTELKSINEKIWLTNTDIKVFQAELAQQKIEIKALNRVYDKLNSHEQSLQKHETEIKHLQNYQREKNER